jgi:cation transport ATPase
MPINVICPGCHARFSVADKFAGQQGPCPKCKAPISIPKPEDQVVIHAPQHEAGAVDAKGRHVLKTYRKKDAKFQPLIFTGVVGVVLVTLLVALVIRGMEGQPNDVMTWLGAILLGPPLAWAGYTFLRDDELEAYQGMAVGIRSVACGLVYALLWWVYMFVGGQLWGDEAFSKGLEIWQMFTLLIPMLALGTGTAYVAFDLDPGSGFFHAAMYFATTVALRLVAGLSVLPGFGTG